MTVTGKKTLQDYMKGWGTDQHGLVTVSGKVVFKMSNHLNYESIKDLEQAAADWEVPNTFWLADDNHAACLEFQKMWDARDWAAIHYFPEPRLKRRDRWAWAMWMTKAVLAYKDRKTMDIPALEDIQPIDEAEVEFKKSRQNAYSAKNRAKAKEARRPGPRDVQAAYMSVLEGELFREAVEIKKLSYDADAIRKVVRDLVAAELSSKGFDFEQSNGKLKQMLGDRLVT